MTELKAELSRLKAELEKATDRERDLQDAYLATLNMLEDLNESYTKIEEAKKEWEAIFDAIADPVFIHDKQFRIMRANRAYAAASGMLFNNLIGKPYYEVFPMMERPFKECLRAMESCEEREEEEEVFLPSIDKIYKVRFYPVKDAEGRLLYSFHIMEDITERKRTEEKIKQEMEVTANLLMIAESTARVTDMDEIMEHVARCSHRILSCDICLSYTWDKEANVFIPSQAVGLTYDTMPLFRTETLDARVDFVKKTLDRREPVIEQFMVEGSEFRMLTKGSALQWIEDINTMVVIPLIDRKDYLGLIIALYKKTREFTERDKRIIDDISHRVSMALEEARLYRDSFDRTMEMAHKIETIQAMHEIDRAILSTLDPRVILETAVIMVSKVVPCEKAAILLVDKERGGLIYEAGFGITFLQKRAYVPFEDTSATEVIKTGRPRYEANLEKVRDILPIEKRFLEEGFLSHISVPLIVKGEVIGLLIIGARRPSAFTTENLSTLEKMASQIRIALENARLISNLEDLFLATVKTLSSAIDAKSPWTAGHSERVTRYALGIGKEMGLSEKELKDLELAGLLHDIGKIGTYEGILDKPGKLSDEEMAIVRAHTAAGASIISPIKQLKGIIPAVRHHHENYDGTGYPDKVKGEEIPLFARILAVADTYDAMKADRPYRSGRTMDFIIAEFRRCSGTQFDPKVVGAFLKGLKQEGI